MEQGLDHSHSGWVYMMSERHHGTLYIGVTSDLQGRAYEHRAGLIEGFTSRYGLTRLVWYERHPNIVLAIQREKSLKRYKRTWKVQLVDAFNPNWDDLYERAYSLDNPYRPHPSTLTYADYV